MFDFSCIEIWHRKREKPTATTTASRRLCERVAPTREWQNRRRDAAKVKCRMSAIARGRERLRKLYHLQFITLDDGRRWFDAIINNFVFVFFFLKKIRKDSVCVCVCAYRYTRARDTLRRRPYLEMIFAHEMEKYVINYLRTNRVHERLFYRARITRERRVCVRVRSGKKYGTSCETVKIN